MSRTNRFNRSEMTESRGAKDWRAKRDAEQGAVLALSFRSLDMMPMTPGARLVTISYDGFMSVAATRTQHIAAFHHTIA